MDLDQQNYKNKNQDNWLSKRLSYSQVSNTWKQQQLRMKKSNSQPKVNIESSHVIPIETGPTITMEAIIRADNLDKLNIVCTTTNISAINAIKFKRFSLKPLHHPGTQQTTLHLGLPEIKSTFPVQAFKMEGARALRETMEKNDFMCKIDLKDACTLVALPHIQSFEVNSQLKFDKRTRQLL